MKELKIFIALSLAILLLTLFVSYLNADEKDEYYYYELGEKEAKQGNLKTAIDAYSMALQFDKENLEIYVNLADVCVRHIGNVGLDENNYSELEKYIRHAQSLRNPNRTENIGSFKISDKLNQILQKNTAITCRVCEAIGDAIIALEMHQNMLLEHTDYSFDHLCKLIDKSHNRHPSEISVVKRQ